jgi:hypothetical protein
MLCVFDRIRTNFICISIYNSASVKDLFARALEVSRAPFFDFLNSEIFVYCIQPVSLTNL